MVYIEKVVPVNNETVLLSGNYWTASKSRIDIESGGFCERWCVHDDRPYFVECAPVASKIVDVNLIIDRRLGEEIPRKG